LAYRNIGVFYENAVNRMLRDFVQAAKPKWCRVVGQFATRGGMHSTITASFGKPVQR
jgi:7-cyano-7-deazaguanine reductase